MNHYNLGFISDKAIYDHVKKTVEAYRREISLSQFNENIIDPIKLTFDAKVYGKSIRHAVEDECFRQIDKSNTNLIGYFHQNLFKYAGNGWVAPQSAFDVENDDLHIYVEMKNKHNTMNSASSRKSYINMQDKILDDKKAVCYLVDLQNYSATNEPWTMTVDGMTIKNERLRCISIDKLYEVSFNDSEAYSNLCKVLPQVLDDVLSDNPNLSIKNHILSKLHEQIQC